MKSMSVIRTALLLKVKLCLTSEELNCWKTGHREGVWFCFVLCFYIYLTTKWDVQKNSSLWMWDKPLGCEELKNDSEKEMHWLLFTLHAMYNKCVLSGMFKERNQSEREMSIQDCSGSLQITCLICPEQCLSYLLGARCHGRWGVLSADAAHQHSPAGGALELGPSHWSPHGAWLKFCVLHCMLDHARWLYTEGLLHQGKGEGGIGLHRTFVISAVSI